MLARWKMNTFTSHERGVILLFLFPRTPIACNPRTDVCTSCHLHPRLRTSRSRDIFCTQIGRGRDNGEEGTNRLLTTGTRWDSGARRTMALNHEGQHHRARMKLDWPGPRVWGRSGPAWHGKYKPVWVAD